MKNEGASKNKQFLKKSAFIKLSNAQPKTYALQSWKAFKNLLTRTYFVPRSILFTRTFFCNAYFFVSLTDIGSHHKNQNDYDYDFVSILKITRSEKIITKILAYSLV